ncbi:HD-GYP domain-containing protein [Effusibacillus consociatus]|uniref:HD-GYP domain-containing protein n=1 Tax=Effusibacillus consociatus TaxID=1117041 RepID=A0ABV9Q1H6_9BACL
MNFAIEDKSAFLMRRLKEHHPYTYVHSLRVAHYSFELAKMMGFSDPELDVLVRSALLHDVGKLKIPRKILDKKGKLDEKEWLNLRLHSQYGAEIVQEFSYSGLVDPEVILYHHENMDGTGYPFGLTGGALSLSVRIVRITDSFDAMTTMRAYNQLKSMDRAIDELFRWSDVHFDLEAVGIFERYIQERYFG